MGESCWQTRRRLLEFRAAATRDVSGNFFALKRRVLLVFAALLLVMGAPPAGSADCTKDTDCKGDRVCEDGTCVNPDSSDEPRTRGSSGRRRRSADDDDPPGPGRAGFPPPLARFCYAALGPCPLVMPLPAGSFCQCFGPAGAFPGRAQ